MDLTLTLATTNSQGTVSRTYDVRGRIDPEILRSDGDRAIDAMLTQLLDQLQKLYWERDLSAFKSSSLSVPVSQLSQPYEAGVPDDETRAEFERQERLESERVELAEREEVAPVPPAPAVCRRHGHGAWGDRGMCIVCDASRDAMDRDREAADLDWRLRKFDEVEERSCYDD